MKRAPFVPLAQPQYLSAIMATLVFSYFVIHFPTFFLHMILKQTMFRIGVFVNIIRYFLNLLKLWQYIKKEVYN